MKAWTTKTGVVIPLNKMTDAHLRNAIVMCVRQNKLKAAAFLASELGRREPIQDSDVYDDCVVGGCDRYGSVGPIT